MNKEQLNNLLLNVSLVTNIALKDIKSNSKKNEIVYAKQLYSYISVIVFKFRIQETGDIINRTHNSISHNIKQVTGYLNIYQKVKLDIDKIILKTFEIDLIPFKIDLLKLCKNN